MGTLEIGLIVGGSILALLIVCIVAIRITNRKRFKRLQENLKKIQEEGEKEDEVDSKISLSSGDEEGKEAVTYENNANVDSESRIKDFAGNGEVKVEDYVPDEPVKPVIEDYVKEDIPNPNDFYPRRPPLQRRNLVNSKSDKDRDRDFEKFMDEHAFSRRVFDKSLLDKIRKLPPEIKAIVLSNVFDKYDDDKK